MRFSAADFDEFINFSLREERIINVFDLIWKELSITKNDFQILVIRYYNAKISKYS
ncbi:hypothetical protein SAMN05444355_11277 [Flavobacterium frigoris]|uniref:Uncharacterized protein n=1 Tax=Flavobacterium frigoris TaxID=229204 RepID=A0A1H9P6S0_FLAFI|nr:hypothetical protein SAMN05444355_11277 [Flavobacterium frigoris]